MERWFSSEIQVELWWLESKERVGESAKKAQGERHLNGVTLANMFS